MHLKKKLIKTGEHLLRCFNIENEGGSNIFGILCFIISGKVETKLKSKESFCAMYREVAVTD